MPSMHASNTISPDEVPAHTKSPPPAVTPARPRKKLRCGKVRGGTRHGGVARYGARHTKDMRM